MVNITYIGHAGFIFENKNTIIITDPWLTPGTFDKAWFQYPRNEHLSSFVKSTLRKDKDIYIYISHEHLDHFDPIFLNSLKDRNFTIITAKYKRKFLEDWFNNYKCKKRYFLRDNEELIINNNVKITLFVEDCEMNRDSGILINIDNKNIYNGNDCKYHNIDLIKKYGNIDVLCQQFSGATWHPVCYEYSEKDYNSITEKKRINKKKIILRYIEKLKVQMYIPCAGPAVFLDPLLIHLKKKEFTIFPRANWIRDILKTHTPNVFCEIFMPGDNFCLVNKKFNYLSNKRVDDYNFNNYLKYVDDYQKDYLELFKKRDEENSTINDEEVFNKLVNIIQEKLNKISNLSFNYIFPTYFKLFNYKKYIRIDFSKKSLSIVDNIDETYKVYCIETYGWQINKVITGEITWDQFHLTLRSKLRRTPDKFQTLLNAFIFQQKEDINRTFKYVANLTNSKEKIKIKTEDNKYYEICKKCPHQGQDLEFAEIEDTHLLICPKHCWKFDLKNNGKCLSSVDSIQAKEILYDSNETYITLKKKTEKLNLKVSYFEYIINTKVNPIIKLVLKSATDIEVKDNTHFINLEINNVVRPYTFTNNITSNKTKIFELYIKLYKDGKMSNLLKNISVGDNVNITLGQNTVNKEIITKNNIVNIIAGGTGITPFIRLINNNKDIKFNIIYINKPNTPPLLEDFLKKCNNTNINFYTSRLDQNKLDQNIIKPYICLISGPNPMIHYYEELLFNIGINSDKIICYMN